MHPPPHSCRLFRHRCRKCPTNLVWPLWQLVEEARHDEITSHIQRKRSQTANILLSARLFFRSKVRALERQAQSAAQRQDSGCWCLVGGLHPARQWPQLFRQHNQHLKAQLLRSSMTPADLPSTKLSRVGKVHFSDIFSQKRNLVKLRKNP